MAFVALYDASVLYPAALRDLLVRLAGARLFRAHITEEILDEMVAALLRNRPDLSAERLARTRELIVRAMPDCLVVNYEEFITALALPDPDDRHVLAAAVRCGAQVIVTNNLRDFPESALTRYGGSVTTYPSVTPTSTRSFSAMKRSFIYISGIQERAAQAWARSASGFR